MVTQILMMKDFKNIFSIINVTAIKMKNKILILVFIMSSFLSIGQSRLGTSSSEIKTEFSDPEYNLETGYTDEGSYFVSITINEATVNYYFDENKICNICIISPKNQGQLNYYVEKYNKQYVIISSTEWKMYSEYGISEIKLIFPDEGGFLFLWSIPD